MSKIFYSQSFVPVVAALVCVLGAQQASAQSAEFATSKVGNARESIGLPTGPFLSPMPLVDPEILETIAKSAPGSKPDAAAGTSGVSSSSELDSPEAYGSSTAVYTTSRVAVSKLGKSKKSKMTPVTSFPYRATGKIYAHFSDGWYICTASLIAKSVLITAAHCIHRFGEGQSGFADEVLWYPANISANQDDQPYGGYKTKQLIIPGSYLNGTDTCAAQAPGVICNNDLATIVLKKRNKKYAGNVLGWYNYGWNGYSYVDSQFLNDLNVVQITQLGYPGAFDKGYQMQRTDAVGWYLKSGQLKSTQMGSAQTGGSSGGPWLANFGTKPKINSAEAALGSNSTYNTVIGVTSYGSTTVGYNRQGASYFGKNAEFPNNNYGGYGAGNIGAMMQYTCTNFAKYC